MPYFTALGSYCAFVLLFVLGHLRDAWRALVGGAAAGAPPRGYAPLCKDYEDFYTRRMYMRIHDVFNRPIASAPDAWIDVVERERTPGSLVSQPVLRPTGATRRCLNLGSYNYLGFAAADPYCTQRVRRGAARAARRGRAARGRRGKRGRGRAGRRAARTARGARAHRRRDATARTCACRRAAVRPGRRGAPGRAPRRCRRARLSKRLARPR